MTIKLRGYQTDAVSAVRFARHLGLEPEKFTFAGASEWINEKAGISRTAARSTAANHAKINGIHIERGKNMTKTGELKKTKSKRKPPPPGPGRPKGSMNKVTRELAGAAQEFTETALATLVSICERGKSEAARVAAACALLDRGYGKPRVQIAADISGGLTLEQLVLGSFKHEAEAHQPGATSLDTRH